MSVVIELSKWYVQFPYSVDCDQLTEVGRKPHARQQRSYTLLNHLVTFQAEVGVVKPQLDSIHNQ